MRLHEFKRRVIVEFGPELEHATPANVREFLDSIQVELWREERAAQPGPDGADGVIELHEMPSLSYEGILRQFFARALHTDNEQALILLWTLALDLAYSGIEETQSEHMNALFSDIRRVGE